MGNVTYSNKSKQPVVAGAYYEKQEEYADTSSFDGGMPWHKSIIDDLVTQDQVKILNAAERTVDIGTWKMWVLRIFGHKYTMVDSFGNKCRMVDGCGNTYFMGVEK